MLTIRPIDESDVERLVALHEETAPRHYVGDWVPPTAATHSTGGSWFIRQSTRSTKT